MTTLMNDIRFKNYGITLLRVTLGVVFLMHGWQKLFDWGLEGVIGAFEGMGIPAPAATAVFATGAELLGGLALILGLFTRYAAVPLAITMVGAIFTAHLSAGFFLPEGFEYVLTLLAGSGALILTGPGALALDNLVGREEGAEITGSIGVRDSSRAAA